MSQGLQVLRCYNCETFQVQIVKKVPKWSCKICGEKQSQKKVFFRGSGKECRLIVQDLNLKQQHKVESSNVPVVNDEFEDDHTTYNEFENEGTTTEVSKWNNFVTQPDILCDNDANEDIQFSFERPKKSRKCVQNKNSEVNTFTKNSSPLEIKTKESNNDLGCWKLIETSDVLKESSSKCYNFLDPMQKDKNESMSSNNEYIDIIKERNSELKSSSRCNNAEMKMKESLSNNVLGSCKSDVKLLKPCSSKWLSFLDPLERDKNESMSTNDEDICIIKEISSEVKSPTRCKNVDDGKDNMGTKNYLNDGNVKVGYQPCTNIQSINQSVDSNLKIHGSKSKNIFEDIDCDLDI